MGDAIEDLKAMAKVRQHERVDAWADRGAWLDAISTAGFVPRVLNESSRHCRVNIAHVGWFDFWPSTGRWSQSVLPGGRRGLRGNGLAGLLAALKATAK